MEIGFVHRPIGMGCQLFRIVLQCAPEVGYPAVEIVYRFDLWFSRPPQQHRQAARKGLHVVAHIAEMAPDDVSHS